MTCFERHGMPKTFDQSVHYIEEHCHEGVYFEHIARGVYIICYENTSDGGIRDNVVALVGKREVINYAKGEWDSYQFDDCPKCGKEYPNMDENVIVI